MRMRFTNSIHQTVATEITEAGDSFRSVIAPVSPVPFSVFVYFTEVLIHPVPNAATLCHRLIFKDVPVFFHSTATIAHCVQIFAKDERTVNILLTHVCLNFVHTAVHTAVDVRIVIQFGTFILHGTAFLYRFQPVVSTFEVDTVAGFIAQRPDHDGRMILGTFVHTVCTVHVSGQPSAVFGKRGRPVSHTMRFDIRLINHIQPVAVAKLIPVRMSRIM